MKGRRPKPIDKKEGHDKLPEPITFSGKLDPEPPDDLPETAKEFWNTAVPVLQNVGLLSAVDRPALEMMATAYARAKQAARVLAEEGHLIQTPTGQTVKHPSLAIERDATATFLKLAEQYALTPVARTRLGLAELQRRSLAQEVEDQLGQPELEPA